MKLSRREVASTATLTAIRKLSTQKQKLMLLLAFRVMTPSAWSSFGTKFDHLKDKSVAIVRLNVARPYAKTSAVKRGYLHILKDSL